MSRYAFHISLRHLSIRQRDSWLPIEALHTFLVPRALPLEYLSGLCITESTVLSRLVRSAVNAAVRGKMCMIALVPGEKEWFVRKIEAYVGGGSRLGKDRGNVPPKSSLPLLFIDTLWPQRTPHLGSAVSLRQVIVLPSGIRIIVRRTAVAKELCCL